jgi:hypothetical protein
VDQRVGMPMDLPRFFYFCPCEDIGWSYFVYTIAFMSLLQIVWRGPAKFVGPRQIGCSMVLTDSTRPSHSGLFCQARKGLRQMDRIP